MNIIREGERESANTNSIKLRWDEQKKKVRYLVYKYPKKAKHGWCVGCSGEYKRLIEEVSHAFRERTGMENPKG